MFVYIYIYTHIGLKVPYQPQDAYLELQGSRGLESFSLKAVELKAPGSIVSTADLWVWGLGV